jgi:hypothetical protein
MGRSAAVALSLKWPGIGKYLGASALPVWALWSLARPMFANPLGYDEQIFVWGGWSILKGLAPYKDFVERKPPLVFLTHALGLKLFGFVGDHFRYFFFLLALASIAAILWSLISRGTDWIVTSALGLAIVHMLFFPGAHEAFVADAESIGLAYYYLGIAALIANVPARRAREIAGGILLTCCGLSKEPFIPCVVATWAGCYFLVNPRFTRWSAKRYFLNTTLGVAIAFGALLLYMAPTGALSAYVNLVRGYAVVFTDPQKGYCPVLGAFAPTGHFWVDLPRQWEHMQEQFINVASLGFMAPFLAASLVLVPRRSVGLFLTSLAAVILAFHGVTATHCYFMHYYIQGEAGLMFFLIAGVDALGRRLRVEHRAMRLWIRSAMLLAMLVVLWPRTHQSASLPFTDGPAFPEPTAGAFDLIRAKTQPTDRILSTGAPGIYVFLDRLPATTTYSFIDEALPALPGTTDEEKLRPLAGELRANPPKVVVLDPQFGPRKQRHMAALVLPFLQELKYVKVTEQLYVQP